MTVVPSLIMYVTEYSLHGLDFPTMPNWNHVTAQEKNSKLS